MNTLARKLVTNRIAPLFAGKLVETTERAPRKAELTPELEAAFGTLVPQLAPMDRNESYTETVRGIFFSSRVAKWRQVKATKTDCFRELPGQIAKITELSKALFALFPAIVKANLEFRGVSEAEGSVQSICYRILTQVNALEPPAPPVLPLTEIAVKEVEQVHKDLNLALREATFEVVQRFFAALTRLARGEMVGGIKWASHDVCEFWFYRLTVQDETLQVRDLGQEVNTQSRAGGGNIETTLQHQERDILRTLKHSVHVHKVINAQRLPGNTSLEMPNRVREFLRMIPPFLAPFVEIVSGDEYFRQILERDLKFEKRTEKVTQKVREIVFQPRDPVVVLNGFALTGWSPEER